MIAQTERELQRLDPERQARATPRASSTCCGCSARCRGGGRRATARPQPDAGSGPSHAAEPAVREWLVALRRANRAIRATVAGVDAVGASSRTPAGCAMRSACRCRSGCRPRSSSRSTIRWATSSAGTPARTVRSRCRSRIQVRARHRRRAPTRSAPARRRPARGRRGVPARARPAPSGARSRCCGGCAAARSRRCARRSSRCRRTPTRGSCPSGSRSAARCAVADGLLQVDRAARGRTDPGIRAGRRWCCLPGSPTYSPAWLDELIVSGEVIWSGNGALAGNDGWVSLHLADIRGADLARLRARATRPPSCSARSLAPSRAAEPTSSGNSPRRSGSEDDQDARRRALGPGLVRASSPTTPSLPLAHRTSVARCTASAHGRRRGATRQCDPGGPPATSTAGPPTVAGRWSLLPLAEGDTTIAGQGHARAAARASRGRHARRRADEGILGGFALVYKVLSGFEETGRARRGYFVDGLGAAQFATGATVDRLRTYVLDPDADAAAATRSRSPRPIRRTPTAPRCPGPRSRRTARAPARPQGRRARHPGRRPPRALRRARRQVGADLHRRRRCAAGRSESRSHPARGPRSASCASRRSMASSGSARRSVRSAGGRLRGDTAGPPPARLET